MITKRTIISSVVAGAILSGVAVAQFAVVDVSAIAKMVEQSKQLVKEYQLLQDTYRTTENAYAQMVWNAKHLTGKSAWRFAAAPLLTPSTHNVYGTSGGWIETLNTGIGAATNYERAAVRFSSPNEIVTGLSVAGKNRFSQQWGTIELGDAAAQHAMSVSGATRAAAAAQAATLADLERATLSDDPAQNTEAALLNKINAGSIMALRSQQDTNRLLAAIADQQAVKAKMDHDAFASEVNAATAAQAAAAETTQSLWGGHGTAMGRKIQ